MKSPSVLWRVLLVLVAALPFAGAFGAEFVHFDDYRTVVDNPHWRGFDGAAFRWMFGEFYNGHYHPLTWLSFAVDDALWGLDPRGFHLTNLVLHALNALLVAGVVRELLVRGRGFAVPVESTVPVDSGTPSLHWAALAGALFFAWHPLRSESVVWVTERRDLLSSFFWLGTIALYLKAQRPEASTSASRRALTFAFVLYAASLLSKAWGITLPVVLLLLDVRPLRRRPSMRLVVEKLPFVLLAALFAVLAAMAQAEKAALSLEQHSVGARLLQTAYGTLFYPLRTFLPTGQSPLHPIADVDFGELRFTLAAIFALAIPLALALLRRWTLLVGWAIYFVIVSPVLGLLQSGPQLVGERYSYLSCLPFAVLVAALVERGLRSPRARTLALASTLAVLACLATLSVRFSRVWHDSESLWSRVVEVYPDTFRSHLGLAGTYYRTGRLEEAAESYRRCTELAPNLYEPWALLGDLDYRAGRLEAARKSLRRAYRLDARPEAILAMARVNAALDRPPLVLEFCAQLAASPTATPAQRAQAQSLERAAKRALGTSPPR